jgi:hypothetical protein
MHFGMQLGKLGKQGSEVAIAQRADAIKARGINIAVDSNR